ncbi:MAG: hypothetical protein ACREDR_28865, partial [Blastocatellia bacterium]
SYDYRLVLTNTSNSQVSLAMSFFTDAGEPSIIPLNMVLSPREVRPLDLRDLDMRATNRGSQGMFGGISITHQAAPGAILAYGMLSKPQAGFASRFFFADPAANVSGSLAAAHIMVGSPDIPDFDPHANFNTVALIRNASDDPVSISPSINLRIN